MKIPVFSSFRSEMMMAKWKSSLITAEMLYTFSLRFPPFLFSSSWHQRKETHFVRDTRKGIKVSYQVQVKRHHNVYKILQEILKSTLRWKTLHWLYIFCRSSLSYLFIVIANSQPIIKELQKRLHIDELICSSA